MRTHQARYDVDHHSDARGSGQGTVRLRLGVHFPECGRLFFGGRNLCYGSQASFGKKADLVIRQIQQGIKDFRCELQQVKRLGNSCSGHAEVLGQVCLAGASTLFEKAFENEGLFHRIEKRHGRFPVGRSRLGVSGFNGRYEKLALLHSRKVRKESQIEEVRKSFGRAEPVMTQCENW